MQKARHIAGLFVCVEKAYEAVAQGVTVIVAVVDTAPAFAAVDCALIVPATAATAPVMPVRASTVVAAVVTVKVFAVRTVTE